jgi:hypothetical protein
MVFKVYGVSPEMKADMEARWDSEDGRNARAAQMANILDSMAIDKAQGDARYAGVNAKAALQGAVNSVPSSPGGQHHMESVRDAWVNATVTGSGYFMSDCVEPPPDQRSATEMAADAMREYDAALMAKLQKLKPKVRPRTHGDWARGWREAGELAMWEKIIAAINQPAKVKGE